MARRKANARELRFIRRRPVLLGAISLDLFAVLFGGAVALLPAIAKDRLGVGAVGLGWLRAAGGIGAAIVTAATEAVRRMMVSPKKGKAGRAAPAKKPAKARAARAPAKAAAGSKPKAKASKRTAGAARKGASAKAAVAAKPVKSAPRPKAGARRGKAKTGA